MTEDTRKFQHFHIYCLKDGSRLDSLWAVSKHIEDRREPKRKLAMLCGECGGKFSIMPLLAIHTQEKGFHLRKSKIVGYEKHSFDPRTYQYVPPRPGMACRITRSAAAAAKASSFVNSSTSASAVTAASLRSVPRWLLSAGGCPGTYKFQ